jgi:hypothetical protein
MKAEQGYVFVDAPVGDMAIVIAQHDGDMPCVMCGAPGGDMMYAGDDNGGVRLHVACLEDLVHIYRTGRKLGPMRGRVRITA